MSHNNYHPSIDKDFIICKILECPKIDPNSQLSVGNSITFLLKGNKPIHKRQVMIRYDNNNEVPFDKAMALAIKHSFIPELLFWLEENKSWKQGNYFIKTPN